MKKRVFVLVCLLCAGVAAMSQVRPDADTRLFVSNVFHLSEVMLHDVANPPAASRFYAYSILAAYETHAAINNQKAILNDLFRQKVVIDRGALPKDVSSAFCSVYAMLEAGKKLMPSGYMLQENQDKLAANYSKQISPKSMQKQIAYAVAIADQVVAYARTDGYNRLSTYSRYVPRKEDGCWFPTPPEYMGAVEPVWSTVRPFYLDSAAQFEPAPPAPFSRDAGSEFYRMMKEVYDVSLNLTDEQRDIANFWDCNPFAVTYSGHMAIGLKKISPGGHWIGITGIASEQAGLPLGQAILVHTMVATTLHDSFVSCWHEKYKSHRIRPEGAINKLLDAKWRPLLQTPPFPEFTSGHSVLSAAVAVVLTHYFGEQFSFTDTSEEYFGLPARTFTSFKQASQEAAISRLYGGIHFRDACDAGVEQGTRIGNFIVERTKGNAVLK